MQNQQEKQQAHENACPAAKAENKRKSERRKNECEGYVYIEMVGWIDRRECLRRNDDCLDP